MSYDINVQGLAVDDPACNIVSVRQGSDVSVCEQACVTRKEVVPPVPQCDYKDVKQPVIYQPTEVVDVAVSVSNPSPDSTTVPFDIVDTMGEKMEYVGNSATICNPDCVPIDPEDDPATNSWTFSGLTLAPNESLLLTYQAKVTNLAVDETVRNSVTLNSPSGARLFSAADDEPGQCDASVTRRDEPQSPQPIPAMGLLGVSFLTVAIAVIGARLGGRRRR